MMGFLGETIEGLFETSRAHMKSVGPNIKIIFFYIEMQKC